MESQNNKSCRFMDEQGPVRTAGILPAELARSSGALH